MDARRSAALNSVAASMLADLRDIRDSALAFHKAMDSIAAAVRRNLALLRCDLAFGAGEVSDPSPTTQSIDLGLPGLQGDDNPPRIPSPIEVHSVQPLLSSSPLLQALATPAVKPHSNNSDAATISLLGSKTMTYAPRLLHKHSFSDTTKTGPEDFCAWNLFDETPDSSGYAVLDRDMCYCNGIRDKGGGSKIRPLEDCRMRLGKKIAQSVYIDNIGYFIRSPMDSDLALCKALDSAFAPIRRNLALLRRDLAFGVDGDFDPASMYSEEAESIEVGHHKPQNGDGNPLRIQNPQRIEFPRFSIDDDPFSWISRAEQFFAHFNTSASPKVEIASSHLDKETLQRFYWRNCIPATSRWEEFTRAFCRDFGPSKIEEYGDYWSFNSQMKCLCMLPSTYTNTTKHRHEMLKSLWNASTITDYIMEIEFLWEKDIKVARWGGNATSLILAAFESWPVVEHNKRGFEQQWLSLTFFWATSEAIMAKARSQWYYPYQKTQVSILRAQVKSSSVSPSYMVHQPDINKTMRAILIEWLIKVHYKFEFMDERQFLTLNLIDRFLERQMGIRRKFQLVGLTVMLLACKYEEDYGENRKVVVTDNIQEYVRSEKNVLLEFYAPCCEHCKKLVPILDEVAASDEKDSNIKYYQLPQRLQNQMLAHLCLKFRTNSEELQQQEPLDSLPETICSSISHYLFYSVVDVVYLFHGVSNDLLFQLVSEMKAAYFTPKEDVILQKIAPIDSYIFVIGVVDLMVLKNGVEQGRGEHQPSDLENKSRVCLSWLLCDRPFGMETERTIAEQIRGYTESYTEKLLTNLHPVKKHVFSPVLDFQEILLHSFWMREKGWQTIKRHGVYAFLEHPAQFYEIIVYSDYSYMYVDPVMDGCDTKHCVRYKLGKAATMYQTAEETYTNQIAALDTAMSTPVFVQGPMNSMCNRYQLLMWEVVYTADKDLKTVTDTQTESQPMELDAKIFVKFKMQNNDYSIGPLQKYSKFIFNLEDKVVLQGGSIVMTQIITEVLCFN